MAGGYVYIVTNKPNGILYIGVTSDLPRRVYEHRNGLIDGFTKRHGLKRLVWFERYDDIRDAIQREKTMKHWPRAWKARVINAANRDWMTSTISYKAWMPGTKVYTRAGRRPDPFAGHDE